MALTPVCVGWLNYFIHHISNAISVNHIVDRSRREIERCFWPGSQARPKHYLYALGH
jgi:uncharacterized membrane protein